MFGGDDVKGPVEINQELVRTVEIRVSAIVGQDVVPLIRQDGDLRIRNRASNFGDQSIRHLKRLLRFAEGGSVDGAVNIGLLARHYRRVVADDGSRKPAQCGHRSVDVIEVVVVEVWVHLKFPSVSVGAIELGVHAGLTEIIAA